MDNGREVSQADLDLLEAMYYGAIAFGLSPIEFDYDMPPKVELNFDEAK